MASKKSKIIIFLVFFAFLIYGSIESLRTATLASVVEENNLSYSLGGSIVTVYFIGYILSTFVMGALAKRIGSKKVLLMGLGFFLIGISIYILGGIAILLTGAFFSGVAGGAIAVSGNSLVVEADPENKGRNLNWTSLFHSVGSMLMPLYCSFLFATNASWTVSYISVMPILVVGIILTSIIAFGKKEIKPMKESIEKADGKKKMSINKSLIFLLLMVFLYVFSEVGIITWMVEFLNTQKGLSLEVASGYLSGYFLLVMLGRLLGGVAIDRIGYEKSIIFASLLAMAAIAAGIIANDFSAVLLALSGLFFSIIYPTGIAIISSIMPKNTQQAIGLYSACGGVGGAVSGYLMGSLGDVLGIASAMWAIIVLLACVIISTFAIIVFNKKKSEKQLKC